MTADPVTRWLQRAPPSLFALYAIAAAFGTYSCMYGFRRPFAAATFEGTLEVPLLPPVDLKIAYIIAQVVGYCISKFLGIKVVSEMPPARRAWAIVVCIGLAEAALLLFGVLPAPWSALALVLNGLPLAMVWGLVFGFLEGRRISDLLGAGLSASLIVASGLAKTVGRLVLEAGVSEEWMPFVAGGVFLPPLLLCVWMLAKIPPPTEEDERQRTRRAPMDAEARRRFFVALAPGLIALTLAYVVLTAYRDFRDNFARELWDALGYAGAPSILTTAEVPVAIGALLAVGAVMVVRDNRRALMIIHGVLVAGALLTGVSTLLFQAGLIGPAPWMICVGLGLYVAYVPFNCVLFDRLIGAVGSVATAGFLIYVTDAFGYLGSVLLLLYRNFGQPDLSWVDFFAQFSIFAALSCGILYLVSAEYFRRRPFQVPRPEAASPAG